MKIRRFFEPTITYLTRLTGRLLAFLVCLFVLTSTVQAALIGVPCIDERVSLTKPNQVPHNCTANDIAVQDIYITWVGDGCVNSNDTAVVKMAVTLATANAGRYDPGMYINTQGGNAVSSYGSQCVHEALHPLTTDPAQVNPGDPDNPILPFVGPFLNADGDETGDMPSNQVYLRSITGGSVFAGAPPYEGDINQTYAQTEAIFPISCTDLAGNDGTGAPNGYVDFSWAVSYAQNADTIISTSIADTIPGSKSKCTSGVSDTYGTTEGIKIGVPELTIDLECNPNNVDNPEGVVDEEISNTPVEIICTASYENTGIGPGDFIEFRIDYPETYGSITSPTLPILNPDKITDEGGYLSWIVGGSLASGNIQAASTGSFTFTFSVDSNIWQDDDIPLTHTMSTWFNNGTDPALDQNFDKVSEVLIVPVTVSYAYPRVTPKHLDIEFGTATEAANAGFNVYAVVDDKWVKLNQQLIEGALDSLDPLDYHVRLDNPYGLNLTAIGIAGVDVNGVEDRHGPFEVNHLSGTRIAAKPINWSIVREQVKQAKALKEAKKQNRRARRSGLTGKFAYIDTTKDYVYRITHDALLAQGIDLSGLPVSHIAVTQKDKNVPRYIANTTKNGRWQAQTTIDFIGTAPTPEDALYVKHDRYQLHIDNTRSIDASAESVAIPESQQLIFEENNKYAWNVPGVDPFYDVWFHNLGTGQLERSFDLPNLKSGEAKVQVHLSALSDLDHNLTVTLNGTEVKQVIDKGWTALDIDITVQDGLLKEQGNSLVLQINNASDEMDIITYDKLVVSYPSSQPQAPLTPLLSRVESLSVYSLLPSNDENLVIISHPLFIGSDALDKYISQRQADGWGIKVVDVEDIYTSFGRATPDAIKDYLVRARVAGVSHVQLVGTASFDYHDYLNKGSISLIPSIYTHTGVDTRYTPCDSCYVLDYQSLPTLAIGRWPARTLEDLDAIVSKTLAWKANGLSSAMSSLFIADKEDKSTDYQKQLEAVRQLFNLPGYAENQTVVYLDSFIDQSGAEQGVANARNSIFSTLEQGASVTVFSGHGSLKTWSFEGLLQEQDVAQINNIGQPTLAIPLTCYTTYADSPSTSTLAHQLIAGGENGAVAVYGAATISSYAENGLIAEQVVEGLLQGKTLGQAILDGKRALGVKYRDVIMNGNLLGDVTLKLQ